MASTLPLQACLKSNASLVKLLAPPPFLLLFLLLLLSLLLALSLLHINDLLTHSLSSPPLFHSLPLLLLDKQRFLSHLLHIQQDYLGSFLSPCPIFILANLIVFTLFLSVNFSSSSASSDFSDFTQEKFDYSDASLPEYAALPSHDDIFLASPPHQHFVLSQDPPEEYHVLSFSTNYDEPTYYRNVQSYNKDSSNWEKVKWVSINPYIDSNIINGVVAQKEVKKPDEAMMVERVQSTLTMAAPPAYKMLNVDQGKVVEKGLQENRIEEKATRSAKTAMYCSPYSQAVVINMELAPSSRHTRILTNTSMQASHPPLAPLAPSQQTVKAAPLPSHASSMPAQRPPSSPRSVKKSVQSIGSFANDGRYEASKPILDGEKRVPKPSKLQKKPSNMVRSHSDQRLSQRDPSTEVTTVLTIPSSLTNRPHMQRAQSLRSSITPNTATDVTDVVTSSASLTNKTHIMKRAQSLRDNGTNSPSHGQVTRSPSFSASLDGLSDAEANKCFSDFITHRFALMKKELD